MTTVLRSVTNPLTYKALRGAGTLVSFDGNFETKQTVYLENSFEIWRLGDNPTIDQERLAEDAKTLNVCNGKI